MFRAYHRKCPSLKIWFVVDYVISARPWNLLRLYLSGLVQSLLCQERKLVRRLFQRAGGSSHAQVGLKRRNEVVEKCDPLSAAAEAIMYLGISVPILLWCPSPDPLDRQLYLSERYLQLQVMPMPSRLAAFHSQSALLFSLPADELCLFGGHGCQKSGGPSQITKAHGSPARAAAVDRALDRVDLDLIDSALELNGPQASSEDVESKTYYWCKTVRSRCPCIARRIHLSYSPIAHQTKALREMIYTAMHGITRACVCV